MIIRRIAALIVLTAAGSMLAGAESYDPGLFREMRWRMIGPHRGGRTKAAAGIPERPAVFYVGVCNGGVWKTEDYGRTWRPWTHAIRSCFVAAIPATIPSSSCRTLSTAGPVPTPASCVRSLSSALLFIGGSLSPVWGLCLGRPILRPAKEPPLQLDFQQATGQRLDGGWKRLSPPWRPLRSLRRG